MDSTQNITLQMAFAHCASTGSYWAWIIAILVIFPVIYYLVQIWGNKSETDVSKVKLVIGIVFVFAISMAIFMRPVNVRSNTNYRMAAENHWLGY